MSETSQCPTCKYLINGGDNPDFCAAMVDTADHGIHAETCSGYKPKGHTMNATLETILPVLKGKS